MLDRRSHQWATGDRVAFGEQDLTVPEPIGEQVRRLRTCCGRSDLPQQVIHGDLTENVLLADGLAPAIIDFSPYYRPAGFATAIVAVDAIVWFGASSSVADRITPAEARTELLARALIFRLVAAALHAQNGQHQLHAQARAHASLVDNVAARLDNRNGSE